MLRQGAQHALSLCAEACWLAPSTMPPMHCTTLCWLVQYYQCADWRAVCVSPRVAREARAARLSVNPMRLCFRPRFTTTFGNQSRRTLPRCFFIGVSLLRILVLSSSSCVGAVRILVSLASVVSTSSSRGGAPQLGETQSTDKHPERIL